MDRYICKYCGRELNTPDTICRNCEIKLPWVRKLLRVAKRVCGKV